MSFLYTEDTCPARADRRCQRKRSRSDGLRQRELNESAGLVRHPERDGEEVVLKAQVPHREPDAKGDRGGFSIRKCR